MDKIHIWMDVDTGVDDAVAAENGFVSFQPCATDGAESGQEKVKKAKERIHRLLVEPPRERLFLFPGVSRKRGL